MSHDQEHVADPSASRRGYILGNDHALPYISPWSRVLDGDPMNPIPKALGHLSCSYFSTPGQPPTLLALKQHAQSLACAISYLCPTPTAGDVVTSELHDSGAAAAGEGPGRRATATNDAFDWLRTFAEPYDNEDPDHHRPLWSTVNEVQARHDVLGTEYHCALKECKPPRKPGERRQPYASHHNLLMHANACLERLDHEYSATGGLLGILPTDVVQDTALMEAARNSLVGQWLLFTQTLVGRMHDLELAYGNALDTLKGEAVAPLQDLSAMGPDARATGVQIAYPQDRWILTNAGDDAFDLLHGLLDRQEALIEEKEKAWRERGAVGERMWAESGGREHSRGIVYVNVPSRFYRIRAGAGGPAGAGPRGPIFVIPAWERHPGVTRTREAEAQPTVVTVPDPHLAEHVSTLQDRYRTQIERAEEARDEGSEMERTVQRLQRDGEALRADGRRQRLLNKKLQECVGAEKADLATKLATLQAAHDELLAKHEALLSEHGTVAPFGRDMRNNWDAALARVDQLEQQLAAEKDKAAALTRERDHLLNKGD